MSKWGKYEVYIPSQNKRIRGDHGITYLNTLICAYTTTLQEMALMVNLVCFS